MKKLILAAAAVLLAWNIWLTVTLYNRMPSDNNGTMVVENTINGYATDMSDAISSSLKSMVTVVADDKEISGIIYAVDDNAAYIFTDAMITNATSAVIFDSGLNLSAVLLGTDPDTSLSLLKVDIDFKVSAMAQGDSSYLKPGELVSVIGSRRPATGAAMVTYGVVSGEEERRMISGSMYGPLVIETDAYVGGENIGGALINASGELEGMGVSHVNGGQDGMSYAVSLTEMKNVYHQLRDNGTVSRGALGITTRSIDDMESYEKSQLGISLDLDSGVVVETLYVDSPCRDALTKGDLLLEINDESITDSSFLRRKLYEFSRGDTVTFHLIHEGAEKDVSVVLA